MRTVLALLATAALSTSLLACEIQGPPTDGDPFGPSNFADSDAERSDLVSFESACEAYCEVAAGCDTTTDADTCIADCIEPKLTAMQAAPEAKVQTDCSEAYMDTMACSLSGVCEDLSACSDAVDEYVACALTP